jgi:hypothetical protein
MVFRYLILSTIKKLEVMNDKNKIRRKYMQPIIERVIIDNNISLSLESYVDPGDNPLYELTRDVLNNNPLKMNDF